MNIRIWFSNGVAAGAGQWLSLCTGHWWQHTSDPLSSSGPITTRRHWVLLWKGAQALECSVRGGGGVPINEEITGCGLQCSGLADKVGIGQNLDWMILEVFSNLDDTVTNTRFIYFPVKFYVVLLLFTQIHFYEVGLFLPIMPFFFFFFLLPNSGAIAETIFIRSNILCQDELAL